MICWQQSVSVLPRSPGPKESSGSDFCSLGSHKSQHALNCDFSTFPPDNFLSGVFLCSELLFSLCFLVSKPACLNPVLPWSGAGCVWDESRWSSHVCHAGVAVLSPAALWWWSLLCSWSRCIQSLKAPPNSLPVLFLLPLAHCAPAQRAVGQGLFFKGALFFITYLGLWSNNFFPLSF